MLFEKGFLSIRRSKSNDLIRQDEIMEIYYDTGHFKWSEAEGYRTLRSFARELRTTRRQRRNVTTEFELVQSDQHI